MTQKRNQLYLLVLLACLAGYIWLYFCVTKNLTENKSVEVCIIKHATSIPCPSCGSSRSIISLTKGDFIGALSLNPIGYIVALIMLIAPVWIIADVIMRRNTLFNFYRKTETYLKKPKYAIPLTLLVIINWIWNILKEL